MRRLELAKLVMLGEHPAFPHIVTGLDGALERQALDHPPVPRDIEEIGRGDRRDTEAPIAFIRHQSVRRQPRQRLAQR